MAWRDCGSDVSVPIPRLGLVWKLKGEHCCSRRPIFCTSVHSVYVSGSIAGIDYIKREPRPDIRPDIITCGDT